MWGWKSAGGGWWETADGPLSLLYDGKSAVDKVAERAWADWLWKGESRVRRDEDYEARWEGREPFADEHKEWNDKPRLVEGVKNERVGWMYARHGKWTGLEHTRCASGAAAH